MKKDKVVVIGGGIAGIFSALLYGSKGHKVTLVEKETTIGGLLRSQELFEKGLMFDYGTHLLSSTNNKEIDSLLFDDLAVNEFEYLKVGSFYKGLYEKNGFLSDENIKEKNDYFGYMKKMLLTLHNVYMIDHGYLPIHGSMVKVLLRNGMEKNIAVIGDSGAGKSETLEALRQIGDAYIKDMNVIFDVMPIISYVRAFNEWF